MPVRPGGAATSIDSPLAAVGQIHRAVQFRRRADVLQNALRTVGVARGAGVATVADQQVCELLPVALRDDPHEVRFDLLGRVLLGQSETSRDALDVGVDDDPLDDLAAASSDSSASA